MASDSKLPIAIFAGIVALIAIPFLLDHLKERRRPMLHEVRIVTATPSDPVFREGRRILSAAESAEAVLALRIGRRGSDGRWFAPVDRLAIDGQETDHEQTASWPETGRQIRVFWFSVECTNLGGALDPENASRRLQYRTFLAPEMGRGVRAERLPETHNDDHIGEAPPTDLDRAGTIRLYARVEVVETESDVRPQQAATSRGIDDLFNPLFPTLFVSADFDGVVDGSVGELFRLPGFEPRSESGAWNDVTSAAFGAPFTELVTQRFVVSSQTLAAVATTGRPDIDASSFSSLGRIEVTPDRVSRRNRSLRWGTDVEPGDVLVESSHWRILLGDDGNGELDPADTILHCWGRPPELTTLWTSLETETAAMEHLRYAE